MISAKDLMPSWVKGRIDTTDSSPTPWWMKPEKDMPTPWWMKPEKDMPTPEMERLIEVQRSWHRAKQESVMRDNTREKRSTCNSPPPTTSIPMDSVTVEAEQLSGKQMFLSKVKEEWEKAYEKYPPNTEDRVRHPTHYTSHPSGVECIQITEHMGFNMGNALECIWRADLKDDAIEDLQSAKWYIERELLLRGEGEVK